MGMKNMNGGKLLSSIIVLVWVILTKTVSRYRDSPSIDEEVPLEGLYHFDVPSSSLYSLVWLAMRKS
jgi:hypothetical protein